MPALAVSYSGLLGGAERILLDVAAGLPDPPLIACPEGPLARAAREQGLGAFELSERSLELRRGVHDRLAAPLRFAAQGAELRALVRRQRPAVVIAWGMRAGIALATAYPGGGGPAVLLQHNDLLPGPMIARAVRTAATRADLVVTLSRCVADDLDPRRRLASPIEIVPPGVDLDRFGPGPAEDRVADEVLLLGAIERWKRPGLALEAVALAAGELPNLTLRLAGEPIGEDGRRLLDELRTRAQASDLAGRVEFAGRLPDPSPALRRAGCLLHCSDREPYGMVVVEALACGLPVVAPASCGPAEITDRASSRLFAPGDAADAASRLGVALSAEHSPAMRAAARARAEARLDVHDTRAAYAELIDRLTPARSRVRRRPPEPAGSRLAIVTVIHESARELGALLSSVGRHLPAAEVVVVDSGSTDSGAATARAWRDGAATVVELGGNVGFGRGVNAGLELVSRPVTALLNPDVELLDASLQAAAHEAADHPGRLLSPLVLRPDGTRQDTAQHEPGSLALAVHALAPAGALPRDVAAAVEPWRGHRPRPVGWAVGCALVAATETLRRLGPFDERVFMYGEDLDLGLRASDDELETWFWPAARVRHAEGHSARRAFEGEPFELLARRRREVVAARRGPLRAAVDDAFQAATFVDRSLLKRLSGRDDGRERRQLRALRSTRRER